MPVMSGTTAARRMYAGCPSDPRAAPYIIAHSADSAPEAQVECLAAHCHCFLPKPFVLEQLVAHLEAAFAFKQRKEAMVTRATDALA